MNPRTTLNLDNDTELSMEVLPDNTIIMHSTTHSVYATRDAANAFIITLKTDIHETK